MQKCFEVLNEQLTALQTKWQQDKARIEEKKKQFNWTKYAQEVQDYVYEIENVQRQITNLLKAKGYDVIWKTEDDHQGYIANPEWQILDEDGFAIKRKSAQDYVNEMLAIRHQFNTKTFIATFHRVLHLKDHPGTWCLYFTMEDKLVETKFDPTRIQSEVHDFLLKTKPNLENEISALLRAKDISIEWLTDRIDLEFNHQINWQHISETEKRPIRMKTANEYVEEMLQGKPGMIAIQILFRFVRSLWHNEGDWALCYNTIPFFQAVAPTPTFAKE
jgi:hypothetical protein